MKEFVDKLAAAIVALGILVAVAGPASAAEDGEAMPGWTEAMPPATQFVGRLEAEAFTKFAEALSGRIARSDQQRLFAAEDPISAAVAAFLGGEVDDFIDGDNEWLASVSFEHLDSERPLVFALSLTGHDYVLGSVETGLPPVDASRLVEGPMIRLIVPAIDAPALRDEIRQMCAETPDFQCEGPRWMETRQGQVWIDLIPDDDPSRQTGDRREMNVDADFFDRRTPAVEALLADGTGAALYARAGAFRRVATVAESDNLERYAGEIAETSGSERVFSIRRARRSIADAMLASDAKSPATREIEDTALVARGDDGGHVLFEAVQSYTRYGAKLAEAGEVETALPTYGLPRPIVSGEWRYDTKTALGRASAPVWMTDPLLGNSPLDGAWRMFRESDGFVGFAAAVNHPLSAVAGMVDALKGTGAIQLLRPRALGAMVAGAFSFDVEPMGIVQGRSGVTGGMAVALRSGAVEAVEQMVNVG
ncbi:MAG: hypothetical protein ABEN55_08575, partial [Bradymonadaceae bacterium]